MQSVFKKEADQPPQTAVQKITIGDIRNKKIFSHLSDELAQDLLDFIKTYCEVVYATFGKEQTAAQDDLAAVTNENKLSKHSIPNHRSQAA